LRFGGGIISPTLRVHLAKKSRKAGKQIRQSGTGNAPASILAHLAKLA
jgi:hypothetical protein